MYNPYKDGLMYNPYKDEVEKIILEYSAKYSYEYVNNLINNILKCKPLPDEFYKDNHKNKYIITIVDESTNDIKKLPYSIRTIILFFREENILQLFYRTLIHISQDYRSSKFKNYYEPRAMKINKEYNKLINYYSEEYKNKSNK